MCMDRPRNVLDAADIAQKLHCFQEDERNRSTFPYDGVGSERRPDKLDLDRCHGFRLVMAFC